MKNETLLLQSYLYYMISNQLYELITNPDSQQKEIKFNCCYNDEAIVKEEVLEELKKSWIFKDMFPRLNDVENLPKAFEAELTVTTVKEIIDNCAVFRHFRDGLDKVNVRDSEFNYRVFMELDETSEKEITDNLTLHGVNIYEDSIDQDINSENLDVCLHLKNGTYITRTKKR